MIDLPGAVEADAPCFLVKVAVAYEVVNYSRSGGAEYTRFEQPTQGGVGVATGGDEVVVEKATPRRWRRNAYVISASQAESYRLEQSRRGVDHQRLLLLIYAIGDSRQRVERNVLIARVWHGDLCGCR
jgi:hypothetical protein